MFRTKELMSLCALQVPIEVVYWTKPEPIGSEPRHRVGSGRISFSYLMQSSRFVFPLNLRGLFLSKTILRCQLQYVLP